ncbi:MAG TPA: efflux RND transporter periplasmic adaptor subunit [Candidatus Eisenbacteria bacterium]|nr:efflux RND transporter periplasmic adaptor subunit [Candidatus Eisenbacteria bacterium]
MKRGFPWIPALIAVVVVAIAGTLWLRGKKEDAPASSALAFEAVGRRTLVVTIEATGTVEPINLVEVKSKASGQIVRMPVEVGSVVRPGALLVQIDTVDVMNDFRQASAALVAARVQAEVAAAQKKRAEELYASQTMTAQERESALLTDANAQSSLVRAGTDLENARLRLQDATVRAPIAGTVLEKPVAVGQMIASATSSVSGGTTILKMADLRRIRVRALVPESDIGGVRAGMPAAISVDAYPNRRFEGRVEKVEPQAVVQQSVTMFPVLLSIDNEEGLLLPGMNGEVVVTTANAMDALAVPVDAVRSLKDLGTIAEILGVSPDTLRSGLRDGRSGGGDRAGAGAAGGASVGAGGAAFDTTARAERRARRAGARRGGAATQGGPGGSTAGSAGARSGSSSSTRNSLFAVVKTDAGFRARLVRLGVSNFDYAEVVSGLSEGDSVALLSVAEMQAERTGRMAQIRERMGSGIPGASSGGARGAAGGSRGATGGSRRTGG